jgi:hypothetical protein
VSYASVQSPSVITRILSGLGVLSVALFDSVVEAKSKAGTLPVGRKVITFGYRAAGDGGGGTYLVGGSQAVDGYGDHVAGSKVLLLQADKKTTLLTYGAVGDGVADDTAAIQAALNAGKKVINAGHPPAFYLFTSLAIPVGKKLLGDGAKFKTNTAGTAITLGDGAKIKNAVVEGPDAAGVYVANNFAVKADGTVGAYLTNIAVEDCEIYGFGQTAVWLQYARDCKVNGNNIHDCGYAGIQGLSFSDSEVRGNNIDSMTPGSGGGAIGSSVAYGVHITRNAAKSLVDAPRSSNVIVSGNTVSGVVTWEGLDTHGGFGIVFDSNTVNNCWIGIATVNADGGGDNNPAEHCVISNNTLMAGNESGAGIYVRPANQTAIGSGGSIAVSGNSLHRYGSSNAAVNTHGAIYLDNATAVCITGNSLFECRYTGIKMPNNCRGISIVGNTFKDLIAVSGVNRAVSVDGASIEAAINGNSFIQTSGGFDGVYKGFSSSAVALGLDNVWVGTITKTTGVVPNYGSYKLAADAGHPQ